MPHAERDLALSELRERIGRLESRGRGPYVPCASSGAFTQFCRLAYATSRPTTRHWGGSAAGAGLTS